MKAFGQAGAGYFTGPVRLADEICARYRVSRVGQTDEVRESYWLISAERRINHPAIKLIVESAQQWFASALE
jgi:LysR family transcriptional activator of nhaA